MGYFMDIMDGGGHGMTDPLLKGKSKLKTRTNILRADADNARRRPRASTKSYDCKQYDGNQIEEQ